MKIRTKIFVFFLLPFTCFAKVELPEQSEIIEGYLVRLRGNVVAREYGTGLIVHYAKGEAWIVTTLHSISDPESIVVFSEDGNQHSAELVHSNKRIDLAVIKSSADILGPLAARYPTPIFTMRNDFLRCDIGEGLVVLGYPQGRKNIRYVDTEVLALRYKGRDLGAEVNGRFIEEGMSGGIAINSNGEVAGMVTKVQAQQGNQIALLLKAGYIRNFLDQHDVPHDLLRHNLFVGEWKLISGSTDQAPQSSLTATENMMLNADGRISGLSDGNYCIRNKNELIFDGIKPFSGTRLHIRSHPSIEQTSPINFGDLTSCTAMRMAFFGFGTGESGAHSQLNLDCKQEMFTSIYKLRFSHIQ